MHNQKTDVFISRRELESRKLDRAAILTLLIASAVIVGMQVRQGISVPEEPGMMDFSYLESALKSRQHSWLQYSMHQQFTLLIWLPVTKLLHLVGFGAFWHYTTILYFRISAILVALWLTNRRVANNCTSLVMALVCFTATPIRTASLYTHWWSHVIFFLGTIIFLTSTRNRTIRREIFGALCLSVFTSPMWTNLPHLVTGWLVIPYAILLFGRAFEKLQTLVRRIGILTGVSTIVYFIPAIIYANGIDTLREIANTNVQTFSNYGPWLTLQGFAGWWYFDKICIGQTCDYLDPLNPIFTEHVFQIVRGTLIVVCI
ncbi:MAG: hypothetical protein EBU84_04675 [Actinobacteria bacterium]|nr:hypothetical protein [Actinomycetota bacterium]